MACFEPRRRSECPPPLNLPPMSGYASFLSLGAAQINLAAQHVTPRPGSCGSSTAPRQGWISRIDAAKPAWAAVGLCAGPKPMGLPIGVLITGRRFREDACLEAAGAIEARVGPATPIDPVR